MNKIDILFAIIPGVDKASVAEPQTTSTKERFTVEEISPQKSHEAVTATEHFGTEDNSKIDRETFETLKRLGLEALTVEPKYMEILKLLRQMRNTPYLSKARNPKYIDFSRWRMPVQMIELPTLRNEESRSLTPKVPRKVKVRDHFRHRDHSRQDSSKQRDQTRRAERTSKQALTTYA